MLKGFRASISHDVFLGMYPIGHNTYVKVQFPIVLNDTTGRYNAGLSRWTPVQVGEPAQYVIVGAKIGVLGGVAMNNPLTNCKIMRNGEAGHGEENMPLSGTNGPNIGLPGMAEMQVTVGILANPGDYFEVWTYLSASPTLIPPPFYSYFGAGTTMIDPHYGHTAFWGVSGV